jgi:hypothetical protein
MPSNISEITCRLTNDLWSGRSALMQGFAADSERVLLTLAGPAT